MTRLNSIKHILKSGAESAYLRLIIVLAGIVLGQVVLYGPSLAGRKIMLPLDYLAWPPAYLPKTAETEKIVIQNLYASDLVLVAEPSRRFAVAELRAGRIPMWTPYQYSGAPFVWPKFSPFYALQCCSESPVVLAWTQLVGAIVAGLGIYVFCLRVLRVSFWPAAVCAWCYPLTGFFILWQGYPTGLLVYWLPWILLAVDKTVRRASPLAPIGLSAVTCLVLVSGQLDIAGQVLLVSGLYALWGLWDAYRSQWFQCQARRAALALAFAWMLGFLLAAPYLLPVLEYARTGARMGERSAGTEERFPVGWKALPQTVLPDMYGAMKGGNVRYDGGSHPESSAATYTGVLATLLVAPLAWCSRRHRSFNVFWVCLAFFGLSWCLNIPGFVQLLRMPGLNMMSHNRLVFAASFAILALTAVGLDVLAQDSVRWQRWFWLPVGVLAGLCLWSIYRTAFLPEELRTTLPQSILAGKPIEWVRDLAGVRRAQAGYAKSYAMAAVLCGAGIAAWIFLRSAWRDRKPGGPGRAHGRSKPAANRRSGLAQLSGGHISLFPLGEGRGEMKAEIGRAESRNKKAFGFLLSSSRLRVFAVSLVELRPLKHLFGFRFSDFGFRQILLPLLGVALMADLLWFGYGRTPQCDPALYYPRIPILEDVARAALPGRIIGFDCLPPQLCTLCGLRDVRGYDGVDPARMVELVRTSQGPATTKLYDYAKTQFLAPRATVSREEGIRLPPVLDMLGVRHVIFRGSPMPNTRPAFQGPDYWVLENSNALARAFIPRRVELALESQARLERLASPQFNPREVAYVETPVDLPALCQGRADIVSEIPTRVTLALRMETPGLVVLADLWDTGWQAYLNSRPVPILRANHAVRGVVVPAGSGTLEFRYAPASFALGLKLAALGGIALLGWFGIIVSKRRSSTTCK